MKARCSITEACLSFARQHLLCCPLFRRQVPFSVLTGELSPSGRGWHDGTTATPAPPDEATTTTTPRDGHGPSPASGAGPGLGAALLDRGVASTPAGDGELRASAMQLDLTGAGGLAGSPMPDGDGPPPGDTDHLAYVHSSLLYTRTHTHTLMLPTPTQRLPGTLALSLLLAFTVPSSPHCLFLAPWPSLYHPHPSHTDSRRGTTPGWGWTAMQMADKETQQRLKEDDPDYIDLMHIPPAQAMLVKIVYVAELAFARPYV